MTNKYRAKKTVIDGITFDSKAEARRYTELCLLSVAGKISGLQRQVTMPVVINGVKVCKYICDFVYINAHGETIYEDVKGITTPVFNLKKKLIKACYGIDITICKG